MQQVFTAAAFVAGFGFATTLEYYCVINSYAHVARLIRRSMDSAVSV